MWRPRAIVLAGYRLIAPAAALCALVAFAAVPISQARAEADIEVTERTYDVFGSSVEEIWDQMHVRGPYSEKQDAHAPAQTRSTVGFTFSLRWSRGACHLTKIRVHAKINYLFPNWADPAGAGRALAENWLNYREHMQIHEEIHGQMIIEAVHEVDDALRSMGPSSSCRALRTEARKRGEAILRAMAQAQIDYDAETDGGRKQGAVFEDEDEYAEAAEEPPVN